MAMTIPAKKIESETKQDRKICNRNNPVDVEWHDPKTEEIVVEANGCMRRTPISCGKADQTKIVRVMPNRPVVRDQIGMNPTGKEQRKQDEEPFHRTGEAA